MIYIMILSSFNGANIQFVGNESRNTAVDLTVFDGIDNGLKISPRSRGKDDDIGQDNRAK